MQINLVVAAASNHVIGKNNALLWRLPNDMVFFRNTTWGMPVIMGRKTFESLGKPLKGRTNIVVSRRPAEIPGGGEAGGPVAVASIEEALKAAEDTDARACYVIGGAEIYAQMLPMAHRIYLTRVLAEPEGDVYFHWDPRDWVLTWSMENPADERHDHPYRFEIWDRRSGA